MQTQHQGATASVTPPAIAPTSLDASPEEMAVAEAVSLYHRTYSTILKSSGETRLRVLEASHKAMLSSLHPLAGSPDLDLGAFLYACRRLPWAIHRTRHVVMSQAAEIFHRQGYPDFDQWQETSAPGRRRRWYDGGETLGVLIASPSDVDDLVPTLVAYQIEWNKINAKLGKLEDESLGQSLAGATPPPAADLHALLTGREDDWQQLLELWGTSFGQTLSLVGESRKSLRIRLLGGTQVGYAKVTRRWWQQVTGVVRSENLLDRPVYFVSSNTHSLENLVTGIPHAHEDEVKQLVRQSGLSYLVSELDRFEAGDAEGNWNNFLYFATRFYLNAATADAAGRAQLRKEQHQAGVVNVANRTAMNVAAQLMPLNRLDPSRFDGRLGTVDHAALAKSQAMVINIDYPLGLAAYNILREIAETIGDLKGVYILGKAASLNADVGDVMISNVIHDEHSGSTYWLDNVFDVSDIAPYLQFGSGLDNQRAVSVKGTFLQNRGYLDFYYREAFTVVEMEAGPYCNAMFEICEPDRYPMGQPVNFSKLPIDFGVIHYASDTPLTQARTLGARGLSYYGMDSTYAASVAIWRRILSQEGLIAQDPARVSLSAVD